MSKAEEDRDNTLLNLAKQMLDLSEDQKNLLREMEKKSNERHAAQRLSDLKEKVKDLDKGTKLSILVYKKDIIKLIEEMENDE